MTMADQGTLLHNMSAPPKSVVKYSGLAALATTAGPSFNTGMAGVKFKGKRVFGRPVRFELPAALAGKSCADILRHLEVEPSPDPERQLIALINARADELPLPGACLVIPVAKAHRLLWADALSALAILAKCSDCLWLRAKDPALKAALIRRQASLLVPPLFVRRLPKVPNDNRIDAIPRSSHGADADC
jgi:hypothetical protein